MEDIEDEVPGQLAGEDLQHMKKDLSSVGLAGSLALSHVLGMGGALCTFPRTPRDPLLRVSKSLTQLWSPNTAK